MPCTHTGSITGDHLESAEQYYQEELTRLTRENDQLREFLIEAIEEDTVPVVPQELFQRIKTDQEAHRKEDLIRLEHTLREQVKKRRDSHVSYGGVNDSWHVVYGSLEAQRLVAVLLADPRFPLKPQLGFDPDSL